MNINQKRIELCVYVDTITWTLYTIISDKQYFSISSISHGLFNFLGGKILTVYSTLKTKCTFPNLRLTYKMRTFSDQYT